MSQTEHKAGMAMIVVICFTAVAAVLAIGLWIESGSHLRLSQRQEYLEQAFYVAEGGAERAVTYIRAGGAVPGTITGALGRGTYSATILALDQLSESGGQHTLSGRININPDNHADYQFLLVKPDGSSLSRADLTQNQPDYSGPAHLVHVNPKGNSDQVILVDGVNSILDHNSAYTFTAESMAVILTNDNRNAQGKAVGKWWIHLDSAAANISANTGDQPENYYTIYSIGNVRGIKRNVILNGVHQQSWAKYALWFGKAAGKIIMASGDHFYGPVHANEAIYLDGDPIFEKRVTSSAKNWGAGSVAKEENFKEGYEFNVPTQNMASINFTNLKNRANLVITGQSSIKLEGTNLLISNPRRGWSNYNYAADNAAILSTGTIYIVTSGKGTTNLGMTTVGGELKGRLTIITDYDIHITNHLTYAVHPTNGSRDALGLIARNDVVVRTNAPNNLNIYAHIIAACPTNSFSHGFYVQNYSTRPKSGDLTVYGGIVEYTRGAVAQGTCGYDKKYYYDARFASEPPPGYPTMTNEYLWTGWREKTL